MKVAANPLCCKHLIHRGYATDKMLIKLDSDVEAALNEIARRQGISPEELANEVLREQLIPKASPLPQDEWKRAVLGLGTDCGVSLRHAALSSEGLYE